MLACAFMPSPLATSLPWELVAKEYAQVTAPFFQHFARAALALANLAPGARVLDVATGPGTLGLLAAKHGCMVTAVDFSPAMIEELRANAAKAGLSVDARVADGQALPLPDASFDVGFSMFGLIFFPDRARGLREMFRVLAPGGVAVLSSWLPMERFPLLAEIFVALRALLPDLPFGDGKSPLGDRHEMVAELHGAGFAEASCEEFSASLDTTSLAEAWNFMSRGSAPFSLLRKTIGERDWARVERGIVEHLLEKYGPGPQRITMVANLGMGRKPA